MTKQQAAEQFNSELIDEVKKTMFPDESLAPDYSTIKDALLSCFSFSSLQRLFPLSWGECKVLRWKNAGYTLFEVQLINTLINDQPPKDLEAMVSNRRYEEIIDSIMEMGEVYNSIVTPIVQRIQKRIEIMSNAKGAYKEAPVKFMNQ